MVEKFNVSKFMTVSLNVRVSLALFFGFLFCYSNVASAQENTRIYTVGVVPQFDARKIYAVWRPILNELQQRTGLTFLLKGASTIPQFEVEFAQGDFDFVYMNPFHILTANKKQGYVPLLRDVGRKLYGIVVVRKDSPIKSMEDLQGKVVAFPAPNALGASLMIRADLVNKYKVSIKDKYVNTHSSVYLNVALDTVDAGGGVNKTFMQQKSEIRAVLRILYETERVSSHPISVHPRVAKKVVQQVKMAFLAMGEAVSSKKMLAKIPIREIGSAEMDDYAAIKKLGLNVLFRKTAQ